ncbi:MAG: PSD1 and planctomycete cytochrome C domain-containing protein [Verrucomicrobiota bacterium]
MTSRWIVFVLAISAAAGLAEDISPAGRAFFEKKIRPVLVAHCYECHSANSEKLGGKLLLDTRAGWMKGGESGTALIPGKPEESVILSALHWENDLEMPPDEPLSEMVIHDFAEWIRMGAPDPRSGALTEVAGKAYDEDAVWSFQPVQDPQLPKVQDTDWPRDPIDQFTLARMEAMGLTPTQDAEPTQLIRRLYFDLIGLPPTMEQVEAFVANPDVAALVDELLASPHFGERWGRHWLDVARYAESNGNDGLSRNPTFPHAWRYRDYVIAAFNSDTPYDRFLTEQIAGDLLTADSDAERDKNVIATGFLALAAKPAKAMNNNFAMDVVADQIDVIGSGVMGISVACARCHDHKFDPVPTRDYYALAGIFNNTETMWGLAANETLTAPKTDLHVLKTAPHVKPPEGWKETVLVLQSNTGEPKPVPTPPWPVGTPLAMGAKDKRNVSHGKVNIKGEANKLGAVVKRGFVEACNTSAPPIPANESGRRELAAWLTTGEHPQTARVFVNRVWLHLFGEGIVRTPDDFGVYGERPTHPQLLDHLATRFVNEDWSIKKLIRSIVLSRTYQLSSDADEKLFVDDPTNLWHARHSRRRLDAESLRDAMLSASGQLNPTPANGSIIRHRDILVNLADSLHKPSTHRSVYLCYLRNSPPPELAAFDLPTFTSVKGKRDNNTVPGQALYLFNSPFVIEQASHIAQQLQSLEGDDKVRVQAGYRQILNRDPDPEEVYRAAELIEHSGWPSFAQALLAASEFRYVD